MVIYIYKWTQTKAAENRTTDTLTVENGIRCDVLHFVPISVRSKIFTWFKKRRQENNVNVYYNSVSFHLMSVALSLHVWVALINFDQYITLLFVGPVHRTARTECCLQVSLNTELFLGDKSLKTPLTCCVPSHTPLICCVPPDTPLTCYVSPETLITFVPPLPHHVPISTCM